MDALKICHLGSIARLDERLETGLHQSGHAAAENSLLAEQIGLGLLAERSLQDTRTAGADTGSICQRVVLRLTAVILIDRDQAGNTLALDILRTYGMTRTLRGDHDDVDILLRNDAVEVDVETVCKHQDVAFLHVRSDLVIIDISGDFIGNEHHDDVGSLRSFLDFHNGQAGSFSLSDARAGGTKTDDDVHAALLQVLRMRMTLAAVTHDGHGLSVQQSQITIRIIILRDHYSSPF